MQPSSILVLLLQLVLVLLSGARAFKCRQQSDSTNYTETRMSRHLHAAFLARNSSANATCTKPVQPSYLDADMEKYWRLKAPWAEFYNYIHDNILRNHGSLHYCVRWDSAASVTPDRRDLYERRLQLAINAWIELLAGFDCFPYTYVPVKVVGWAVRDRNQLLWEDSADTPYVTVNETRENAPECSHNCGRYFEYWDLLDGPCPHGKEGRYDLSLWLTDGFGGGHGGDWGERLAPGLDNTILLHEIGHGFGLPDYYDYAPENPTIMQAWRSLVLEEFDKWMIRRVWSEHKSRYHLPRDPCAFADCGPHGSCVSGACQCSDNYTGSTCQYNAPHCTNVTLAPPNTDYYTPLDIQARHRSSVEECHVLCAQEPTCFSFTLVDGMCYLKDRVSATRPKACNGCISAYCNDL